MNTVGNSARPQAADQLDEPAVNERFTGPTSGIPADPRTATPILASQSPSTKDPIFDPPGLVWQRVSPRLARVWSLRLALWTGIPGLAGLVCWVVFKQWWIVLPAAAFLLGGVWALWLMKRRVRAIGYLEREDDLLIRKGLLFRELMVVPYGRIQYLDLEAGPLDRAFGLSNLTINTAAGGLDASLPGLEPEEAAHLRDRLAERGNAKLAGL